MSSDEVYDGAIGIDLGTKICPAHRRRGHGENFGLLFIQVPLTLALPTTTATMSKSVCPDPVYESIGASSNAAAQLPTSRVASLLLLSSPSLPRSV